MMIGHNQSSDQTPHLAPALTAMILALIMLAAIWFYALSLEKRSITAFAADEVIIEPFGQWYRLKNQGIALQKAAFENEAMLPLYGSSELKLLRLYNQPFHVTYIFRDQPTGFMVFPVGKEASTCLIIMQKLAAVGSAMRGRKVAVSVSPFWFFEGLTAQEEGYAGNFSALHAGELAFNTEMSLQLRQDAARRMLRYPATLADRPLLRFALENLADGTPMALASYDAVFPLGMLSNAILRFGDHWSVVLLHWRHPLRTAPPLSSHGQPVDWSMIHQQAAAAYHDRSSNNEFGLDSQKWLRRFRDDTLRQKNTLSDEGFLRNLEGSQEWVDLELLLRTLTEFGARPLLMSMPLHGGWYDFCGVTPIARRAYYQNLREVGARFHTPVVDFADHDADRSFCFDHRGHLSPNGWVCYDEVLDGFFHDTIPPPSRLP
jgi:D-alanine transfer protein